MSTPQAYIVDAVRTPVGKRNGSLAKTHPADLGAHIISALIERTGIDPAAVDDVVFGCLDAIGGQAGNVARTAWLGMGATPSEVTARLAERQGLADRGVRLLPMSDVPVETHAVLDGEAAPAGGAARPGCGARS